MSEPDGRLISLEMGYSAAEFAAVLPSAMRDWSVSGAAPVWTVHGSDGGPVARIAIEILPDRVMGSLRLPVLTVRIDLNEAAVADVREFQRRFDRGFHRGGG